MTSMGQQYAMGSIAPRAAIQPTWTGGSTCRSNGMRCPEQLSLFGANEVLIEDKASGTQLIQELIADGCHGVTRYQPTTDKIMRLNSQTGVIENGFVHIPETAPWLAEYLHEMTVFPKGKHDDQVDSTAQFLDWYKKPFPSQGHYEYMRQRAHELQQRDKPQPTKTVWAIGSMEWLAEQKEAG